MDLAHLDTHGLTALADGRMTLDDALQLLGPPADRAAAGARQLDRWHPGWDQSITQTILVLNTGRCPLGQVYGGYERAPRQLLEWAWWLGFCPVTSGDAALLDACWTGEVNRRQAARLRVDVDPLADMIVDEHGSSPAGRAWEAQRVGASA
jgi:hypothetical protein